MNNFWKNCCFALCLTVSLACVAGCNQTQPLQRVPVPPLSPASQARLAHLDATRAQIAELRSARARVEAEKWHAKVAQINEVVNDELMRINADRAVYRARSAPIVVDYPPAMADPYYREPYNRGYEPVPPRYDHRR